MVVVGGVVEVVVTVVVKSEQFDSAQDTSTDDFFHDPDLRHIKFVASDRHCPEKLA